MSFEGFVPKVLRWVFFPSFRVFFFFRFGIKKKIMLYIPSWKAAMMLIDILREVAPIR